MITFTQVLDNGEILNVFTVDTDEEGEYLKQLFDSDEPITVFIKADE